MISNNCCLLRQSLSLKNMVEELVVLENVTAAANPKNLAPQTLEFFAKSVEKISWIMTNSYSLAQNASFQMGVCL